MFDEIFYARDACWYVAGSEAVCGITEPRQPRRIRRSGSGSSAPASRVFGYDPFGWRVTVAVGRHGERRAASTCSAWRLLRPDGRAASRATVGAAVAAGLLAIDLLALVQSRVAMLDAFIALFVIGAVLAIVLDRDRTRPAGDEPRPWWWWPTLGPAVAARSPAPASGRRRR